MMPASSSFTWSIVGSDQLEHHPDLPVPVLLCPLKTARRMRLRYDDRRHLLKLTHPRGLSRSAALRWAGEQKSWVERQLRSLPPAEPFAPGAVIPIEGEDVVLAWSETAPRAGSLENGRLLIGGPPSGFERRVEILLKRRALDVLSRETAEIAEKAGVKAAAVSIGDAGTRWGSCSSGRRIRFNWRLILAPVEVRRFVVAHEVAHLVHLNHGARFKALERQLFGGNVAVAEALLRRLGPRLKRIGLRG